MALSQYCFRPVSVCSVTVSAQRTGERLSHFFFMSCHEKKGNVNNFFMKTVKIAFIHVVMIDARVKKRCRGGGDIPLPGKFKPNTFTLIGYPKKSFGYP